MQISWHGLGCFQIKGKPNGQEVTLVTDPYQSSVGLRAKSFEASMVLSSHDAPSANNTGSVSGENERGAFLVSRPGEYEVRGVFVTGVSARRKDEPHTIFRIDLEGIAIGFLGALDRVLQDDELEGLGNIDILLLPIGGGDVLSKDAAEVVSQVEPRLVIPSYHHVDGLKEKREKAEAFCKELACPREDVSKFKVKKSALPTEGLQIVVLNRS